MEGSMDLSSQPQDQDFLNWLHSCARSAFSKHNRKNPCFKFWHLVGGLESLSEKQALFSFYELDSPTKEEINVVKNNLTIFSSKFTVETFSQYGAKSEHVPLGFDSYNFNTLSKKFFSDDRIVFNLCGKFEKRKNHEKIIKTWIKKFGNDKRYYLQCAVYNPFFKPEENKAIFNNLIEGKNIFNVHFLQHMPSNKMYNDFLNSGNIVLAMSGGEGWGLPEFHSLALGKHGVVLNAHSYKDWADEINSVMVNPSQKTDAADGVFFKPGDAFNQGQIFDFKEDEFIDGCEKAINRVKTNPINDAGLLLQERFTFKKTTDRILELIKSL